MVEAVTGEAGLGAVAELAADAVGAPVAIIAPRLGGPWLAPAGQLSETELAVLVGEVMDRVADPRVCASAALVKEAPIVIAGEVIGVVALLRAHASSLATEPTDDSAPGVVGALRIEGVAGVDDATVAPHATKVIHLAAMAALTGVVVAGARQYRTDLRTTLQAYLANNCNMNATAAAVFAHRHTIAYRLERIKELSGLDPSDSEDRERLGLGLKAYQMIHAQLPR